LSYDDLNSPWFQVFSPDGHKPPARRAGSPEHTPPALSVARVEVRKAVHGASRWAGCIAKRLVNPLIDGVMFDDVFLLADKRFRANWNAAL
jgi:hypothetical protein